MSDNVTPIFGETPKKKISLKKQWFIFIAIIVAIIVLLVWFLLAKTTALDGVKRYFRYLGVGESDYGSIRFEAYGNADYAMIDDSFAVASQGGLQVFSTGGSTIAAMNGSFSNPIFDCTDELALLYDVGGTRAILLDSDGEALFDLSVDGRIFDADLCDEGTCAILYEGSDCYTVLDVFNENGAKLYSHRSESAFLNTCALSPDGSYAVVTTLGQEDISFLSTARILTTHAEGIRATVSFGTQLICDLAFTDDDTICAVGEETLFFFDTDGTMKQEFKQENAKLAAYRFAEDQVTVLYDHYELSLGYDLVCLDARGEQTASLKLSTAPQHISRCEKYICILTADSVLIYDRELTLNSTAKNNAYISALARNDGTALCIGSGYTELYIP